MILFLGLFGCFDSNKTNATSDPHPIDDPMCDAICNEQSIFDFSKALDAYQVSVSFLTSEGGTDVIEVLYNGSPSSSYSIDYEVEVNANSDGIQIYSSYGLTLEEIQIEINSVEVGSTLIGTEDSTVCGSVCTLNQYDLNTDSIEPMDFEPMRIEELTNLFACTTSNAVGDLTIVAHNEDNTQALVLHEIDGFDVPGGGYWENGFHNDKLSVELHIGTNVGVNYCTDAFLDEEIAQIYYPIDPSELPDDLIEDETAVFDYSLLFLDCEDCEPLAMLTVENFWFRSELGTYAKVGLVNHLQSDIWLDFGG